MAAILHLLDQRRLIDSNGIADGASIYFYTTGTLTPATVYTTDALNVAHPSPIVVNAGAAVPAIYLDDSITYRRRIVYPDGTVDDTDPYEGGVISAETLASTAGASRVGTSNGSTVQAELNALADEADIISTDLSTVASTSQVYSGAPALTVIAPASLANVADPGIADVGAGSDALPVIDTTTANQLWRVRNNGTGLLSTQSSSTLGTFAVSRKYDVTENVEYTAHFNNAPLGWVLSNATHLHFFNTDGSVHTIATTGFTQAANARSITFTVPAGAEKVAFNWRNFADFSNTNPMTEAALQIAIDNFMLAEGSSVTAFTPYATDDYTPSTDKFDLAPGRGLRITRQGFFTYIEAPCQQSTTKNIIWRVLNGHGVNYAAVDSRSGVVDLWGARFVAKSTAAVPSLFNTSTEVHCGGIDESCPERRNGMFVDGGHGSTCYKVTKAAHGMANVDVGSIWSDGTSQWILLYVESSSVLVFQRRYTGTDTKWNIASAAPGSSTFTHVSGATTTGNIAFTSPTLHQFVPIIREYTREAKLDGVTVSAEGDYSGDVFTIEEIYIGLNLAKVQDALIADVGNSSPNWTPDVEQTRVYNRYEWSKYGGLTVYTSRYVTDAYTRSAAVDYWAGIQLQRLSLTGDSTPGMHSKAKLYVPDVQATADADGGNFSVIRDVTSNAAQIDILASDCDDPTDPASLFCLIGTNSGDAILSGQAFGYDTEVGLAVPATRAANCNRVFYMSNAEKNYPILIDSDAGDAASGDTFEAACFRVPFLPTDADLTIPGVIYQVGIGAEKKTRCIIAAHQTLSAKAVAVPAEFSGRSVTILRGDGLTLDSGFVRDGEITVSVAGTHGWAVLAIG